MKIRNYSFISIGNAASNAMLLVLVIIYCGCSHVHTYRFELGQENVSYPPIDLSSFFLTNGLHAISHEDGLYQMFAQRGEKELLEIWLSEGARVFEYWDDETYEIIIEPWNNGLVARNIAINLSQWIEDNKINIKIKYDKDPVFQWQ